MNLLKKSLTNRAPVFFCFFISISLVFSTAVCPQETTETSQGQISKKMFLSEAAMCEGIKDFAPQNQAIVFSMEMGKVYCFTSFENIPQKSFVYHNWYRQDRLITTKRLTLQPPEWSSFSSIQLREADKGPWRVEINDQANRLLDTLRFSIVE